MFDQRVEPVPVQGEKAKGVDLFSRANKNLAGAIVPRPRGYPVEFRYAVLALSTLNYLERISNMEGKGFARMRPNIARNTLTTLWHHEAGKIIYHREIEMIAELHPRLPKYIFGRSLIGSKLHLLPAMKSLIDDVLKPNPAKGGVIKFEVNDGGYANTLKQIAGEYMVELQSQTDTGIYSLTPFSSARP